MSDIEENILTTSNFSENVLPEIKKIIANIPKSASPLEKIRWIYIKLGQIFCYDYRIGLSEYQNITNHIDMENFVGRYETCIEIVEVLNYILNKIEGVNSRTVIRRNPELRGHFTHNHVANEVIVEQNGSTLKIMLDLVLDLYLIQSNCLTMHFGYEDDSSGTYDILPQSDNRTMDINLGFIDKDSTYTDEEIRIIEKEMKSHAFLMQDPMQIIENSILLINKISKKFVGYHEGKQYMNMLFHKLLSCYYKEFNLFFKQDDEVKMITIYKLELNGYEKWIVYSNNLGILEIDFAEIVEMLDNGWTTNSETLMQLIDIKKKQTK